MRIFLSFLFLVLTMSVAGQVHEPVFSLLSLSDPQSGVKAYNEGVILIQSGEYETALVKFRHVLQSDSGNTDALMSEALCLYSLGRCNEAVTVLNALLSHRIKTEYLYLRGLCNYCLKDYSAAEADLSRCLGINMDYGDAYYARSRVRHAGGDPRGAVRDLLEYTSIEKNSNHAWYDLAVLYNEAGQYDKALEWITRCIQSDTANPDHAYLYAIILEAAGRRDEARDALTDLTSQHPDFLPAWNELALLLTSQGKLAEAEGILGSLLNLSDSAAVYLANYAFVLFRLAEYDQSLHYFTKAISRSPDEPLYWFNRGICKEMLRDARGACMDWSQAAELGMKEAEVVLEKQCR